MHCCSLPASVVTPAAPHSSLRHSSLRHSSLRRSSLRRSNLRRSSLRHATIRPASRPRGRRKPAARAAKAAKAAKAARAARTMAIFRWPVRRGRPHRVILPEAPKTHWKMAAVRCRNRPMSAWPKRLRAPMRPSMLRQKRLAMPRRLLPTQRKLLLKAAATASRTSIPGRRAAVSNSLTHKTPAAVASKPAKNRVTRKAVAQPAARRLSIHLPNTTRAELLRASRPVRRADLCRLPKMLWRPLVRHLIARGAR
ncbi:MAG: hypothetical protein HKO55_10360 [Gammaproteobacteria bacterium]|nr:hypothetical protein [Gammaproteobacteria bacterium]